MGPITSFNRDPGTIKMCLPLGVYTQAINYSPTRSANDAIYKADKEWFKLHPKRFWTIRKTVGEEFGHNRNAFVDELGMVFPPALWVHVSRHPKGLGHRVIPVFLGALPQGVRVIDNHIACESDETIGDYLDGMHEMHGVNEADIVAWHIRYEACMARYHPAHGGTPSTEQVH